MYVKRIFSRYIRECLRCSRPRFLSSKLPPEQVQVPQRPGWFEPRQPLREDGVLYALTRFPPEKIAARLIRIKRRLQGPMQEDYGPQRGYLSLEKDMKENPQWYPDKRTTKAELRVLLSKYHALKHGGKKMDNFTQNEIAKTFFGKKSRLKMKIRESNTIMVELFHSGHSTLLENLRVMNNKLLGINIPRERNSEKEELKF